MIHEASQILFATLSNDLLVFLNRPPVQVQLFVILAAFITTYILWNNLSKRAEARLSTLERLSSRILYFSVKLLLFAFLAYSLLQLASLVLWFLDFEIGLIKLIINIVIFYAGLQIILIVFYCFGDIKAVDTFRQRWFKAFAAILVLGQIISILTPINDLLNTSFLTFSETTITIQSILIGTIGLYFWIVGIQAVDTAIHYLAVKYLAFGSGGLKATLTLLRYILFMGGIAFVLSQFNFDTTTIAAITGGLSVGIGFALSTVLSNFVSGLLLLFERSVQPGDVLEFENELSVVEDVQMRAMRVRTQDNIEKYIPNTDFVSAPFTTYTGTSQKIRVALSIGASYKDKPEDVIATLLELADKNADVLKEPKPEVFLDAFADSSINYTIKFWIANPLRRLSISSQINLAIYKTFEEKGITIPFPQNDVHLHMNK